MIGDFLHVGQGLGALGGFGGGFGGNLGGGVSSVSPTVSATPSRNLSPAATALIVNASSFKISENESVLPQDRIYINYNYFNNVGGSFGATGFDVHRETFGFEKILVCDFSAGVRVPVLITDGSTGGVNIDGLGDISLVLKWAAYHDCRTGDAFSAGMVFTLPTGRKFVVDDDPNKKPVYLFQPWVGGICNYGCLFVHGFSSVILSTEPFIPTLLSNDIGVGYRLYQSETGCLSALTPTLEAHLTTPLGQRGGTADAAGFPDVFDITGGVHIGWNNAELVLAVSVPVSGPRPYDYELIAQLNVYW
jgi:hypothetical protein